MRQEEMEVYNPSVRLVGAPRGLNGRKMSGLGIDFSEAAATESPLYQWEAEVPHRHSFIDDEAEHRPSRWSDSTQQSRATKTTSTGSNFILQPLPQDPANRRQSSRVSQVIPRPPDIVISKRPSEAEVQAYLSGRHSQRSERGSNDSQNSYGPITPQDELDADAGMVTIAGISNFGESPRKAPVPPAQTNATTANITSTLSRRSSLSQSMMRTLNGRKKDTKPPAPLNLPPSVPTVPARYDVAPIVHHLDRPLARRRESTTGNCIAASPGLAHTAGSSPNTHSNDDRPPSRGSLGILFRSVRKSISRRASKASPSLQAQGSTPGSRSGAGSIKSNAPSFVNVQVETFMEVQSTPSSPAIDRKAALQAINPDSQAAAIASRPQTAPAGGRKEHSFKLQIPSLSQKSTPTSSKYSSPLTGQESRLGGFQIQYTDPWQKTSAFQPASDYSLVQTFPPSPPSRTTKQKGIASLPRDEREKQEYMDSKRSAGPIQSSSSDDSASPTSIPSWTPMMALPSPNVSVIVEQTPPPVSFLDLEATPAPFVKVASSISGLGQPSNLPESNKSAFYLTPGRVSMRDPWAKSSRSNESSRNKSTCSRGDLGTTSLGETLNASNRSPSSIESFASPGLAASPQSRQLSRKAVPKIDEREIIATSTQENEYGDTTSNKIYAGCRPFRRPSAEQQLSDRSTDKSMFKTRASLGNVREGYVEEYIPEVGRSQSLAGRGNVILPPAPAEDGEAWYNRVGRPSYPVFENTYSLRRPSYASERSNQSFPSKPTRLEFRRPSTLAQSDGMRVSFDATTDL